MREKGQTEVAKTLETPVFSRGIEILTEKIGFILYYFLIGGMIHEAFSSNSFSGRHAFYSNGL